MATTRIIPMHINKGKTTAECLAERTAYAINSDKTEGGEYVSSFACDPRTADMEFLLSKRQYRQRTGKSQSNDIIAYQVRQSFRPGEVTPEQAKITLSPRSVVVYNIVQECNAKNFLFGNTEEFKVLRGINIISKML